MPNQTSLDCFNLIENVLLDVKGWYLGFDYVARKHRNMYRIEIATGQGKVIRSSKSQNKISINDQLSYPNYYLNTKMTNITFTSIKNILFSYFFRLLGNFLKSLLIVKWCFGSNCANINNHYRMYKFQISKNKLRLRNFSLRKYHKE